MACASAETRMPMSPRTGRAAKIAFWSGALAHLAMSLAMSERGVREPSMP